MLEIYEDKTWNSENITKVNGLYNSMIVIILSYTYIYIYIYIYIRIYLYDIYMHVILSYTNIYNHVYIYAMQGTRRSHAHLIIIM